MQQKGQELTIIKVLPLPGSMLFQWHWNSNNNQRKVSNLFCMLKKTKVWASLYQFIFKHSRILVIDWYAKQSSISNTLSIQLFTISIFLKEIKPLNLGMMYTYIPDNQCKYTYTWSLISIHKNRTTCINIQLSIKSLVFERNSITTAAVCACKFS